jgi:hypothetical protein
VQLTVTAALTIALVALTLTTRQPPPPAIAEFAPQAVQQIKQAPKEQASQFGSGKGPGNCPPGAKCGAGTGPGSGTGPGGAGGTPPSPPTTFTPPGLPCVGNPPRQIEDPQSPPCISYWDSAKGNGGATSFGVTKDTITVAAPDQGSYGMYTAWANFFNNRFQFYGRKIIIVNPNNNNAAGADAAKQLGAFAGLTSYSDPAYYRQLVKHKIIGIYRTTDFSDSELAAASPYLWGYTMSFTQIEASLADWTCRRLVGQPAAHAGTLDGADLSTHKRSFGIFLEQATVDSRLKADILKSGIEACGGKVSAVFTYPRETNAARDRNEVTQLKDAGTTTNFCLCVSPNLVSLQSMAQTQNYQPEWIITSYPQLVVGDSSNGPQMDRTFGVSFGPMDRVRQDHPSLWAELEGNPSINDPVTQTSQIDSNDIHYRGFLLLASGIQMAGPHLTPESFKEGLQKTTFPNPNHPIMAGTVGFEGDYSMTNDGVEFWFGVNEQGPYTDTQNGPTFCYVDHGARHVRGTWPTGGDPFFKQPCDSGKTSVS